MNGACPLAERCSVPAVQDRLHFSEHRKRHRFRRIAPQIKADRGMDPRLGLGVDCSALLLEFCEDAIRALLWSQKSEVGNRGIDQLSEERAIMNIVMSHDDREGVCIQDHPMREVGGLHDLD